MHGQGQRPGQVRGCRGSPRTRAHQCRAGARSRPHPRQGHHLRRGAQPPDPSERQESVFHRQERVGTRGRDRLPRRSVERPDRGSVRVHPGSGCRPRPRRGAHQLRRGHPDRPRRRNAQSTADGGTAQRLGGQARGRPYRRRRGPASRHQEPRGLRGPGGDGAHRRSRSPRGAHDRARPRPLQARCRSRMVEPRLRRTLVLRAQALARCVHQ